MSPITLGPHPFSMVPYSVVRSPLPEDFSCEPHKTNHDGLKMASSSSLSQDSVKSDIFCVEPRSTPSSQASSEATSIFSRNMAPSATSPSSTASLDEIRASRRRRLAESRETRSSPSPVMASGHSSKNTPFPETASLPTTSSSTYSCQTEEDSLLATPEITTASSRNCPSSENVTIDTVGGVLESHASRGQASVVNDMVSTHVGTGENCSVLC